MAEKTVEEKLDAIFDSISRRMDSEAEERKADRARLDAACSKMDAWDEEKKADKARKDAEMMATDKAKKDAEEEKARKDAAEAEEKAKAYAAARKDAEEKEEKAKADAARGTNAAMAARLAALEAHLSGTSEDRALFVSTQQKAERVYQAFGDSAERWLPGEGVNDYRARLAGKYKAHAKNWKDVDLTKLPADVLGIAETQIYADAYEAAMHPASAPEGQLREIKERDQTGRNISRFVGRDDAAWSAFSNSSTTGGKWTRPASH
jgi:hypothetical protein